MRTLKLLAAALPALALLTVPGLASARSVDRDRDRLPDRWERTHKLSTKAKSAHLDGDGDGLVNLAEFRARTDPRDRDTDNDGMEDTDEDRDRDGLDNQSEGEAGTKVNDPDSDGDRRRDGREDADRDRLLNGDEDATGNDPSDPDTDDDGTGDSDEHAGTVASFANGVLVIRLPGGATVTGSVGEDTVIECETEDEHAEKDESEDESISEAEVVGAAREDDGPEAPGESDGLGSDDADEDLGFDAEHEGDEDDRCSEADLTVGTPVHEAELDLEPEGPVFIELELVK